MNPVVYGLLAVLVTAIATYIPRAMPFLLFRRPVENRFFKSFLEYMPVAVLAAMTFPDVFDATASPLSAVIGVLVALFFSFLNFSLLPVALLSSAAVFVTELIMFGWQ